jgi:hypothetical protein
MPRRIYGPKGDEVTGGWRKLHDEELHNLYSSPNIIMVIRSRWLKWVRHVVGMGETRNTHNILVTKPQQERTTWQTEV